MEHPPWHFVPSPFTRGKPLCIESCGLQVAFLEKHAELIVKIRKYTKRAEAHSPGFFIYIPRHEVKPKVVATAVRIVMMMLRIFPQSDLFSIVF